MLDGLVDSVVAEVATDTPARGARRRLDRLPPPPGPRHPADGTDPSAGVPPRRDPPQPRRRGSGRRSARCGGSTHSSRTCRTTTSRRPPRCRPTNNSAPSCWATCYWKWPRWAWSTRRKPPPRPRRRTATDANRRTTRVTRHRSRHPRRHRHHRRRHLTTGQHRRRTRPANSYHHRRRRLHDVADNDFLHALSATPDGKG